MLQMDHESVMSHLQLLRELEWLKDEHPDKTALIAMAESTALTIKMAGSRPALQYRGGPNLMQPIPPMLPPVEDAPGYVRR